MNKKACDQLKRKVYFGETIPTTDKVLPDLLDFALEPVIYRSFDGSIIGRKGTRERIRELSKFVFDGARHGDAA